VQLTDTATATFTVTADDTARALGSGDLDVLGTPRLLAWCEAVTCRVVDADSASARASGGTSVGTRVQLEHVGPSPVGAVVEVRATVVHLDGRLVRLEVVAEHRTPGGVEQVVGHGEVTRVVVDRDRFLARVPR
jgi:fluoroacetyl-CoA thioesterase